MIEIDFRYKRKSYIIKCSINDILKNICQDFTQKNSLDFDEILFTYKGRKLNLDLNLSIKQQFNLDDNGDIIRKKIFVYNQTSICIHFFLIPNPNPDIINCKKSDKLLDILLKYIAEKGLKKENLQFLYQAEELINVNDKTVGELITKNDKSEGIMTIMVRDYVGISRSNSIISQDKVVFRADPPPMDEKHFYFRISKILGVQYIYIILFTTIGILCEINKIFMNDDVHIIFKILPILLFIFSLSFLLEKYIKNNKSSNYMIIIHTSYTIFIIYYCLLISVYLEYKYIIIGLCLILLEVLSLGIYVLIFKVYKLLFFCLASFSLSLLGHILFSTLWVQSLLPIVYVSIFYILTNIYFILTFYISKNQSENEEYYYPVIIFEYGIFLGLEYGIKKAVIFIYRYITGNLDEYDIAKEKAKIFIILLIQYTIIIIVVWITFAAIGKESVSLGTFHALFWICTVINLIICIVIVCNSLKPSDSRGYYFCSIIYVPIMISYYIAFSYAINKEQILSFLFIIFFDLLSIVILILVFKTDHCGFVFIACIIPSIIAVICYHFCWFHKQIILTNISVIASFIIIYIVVGFIIIKRVPDGSDEYYENYYIFSVILFDYGFFGVVFAITFGIIALIIFIIGCICENCKS